MPSASTSSSKPNPEEPSQPGRFWSVAQLYQGSRNLDPSVKSCSSKPSLIGFLWTYVPCRLSQLNTTSFNGQSYFLNGKFYMCGPNRFSSSRLKIVTSCTRSTSCISILRFLAFGPEVSSFNTFSPYLMNLFVSVFRPSYSTFLTIQATADFRFASFSKSLRLKPTVPSLSKSKKLSLSGSSLIRSCTCSLKCC